MKKATQVFYYSVIISIIVVIWGAAAPENLESVTAFITGEITSKFGWFYLLLVVGILVLCVYMMFSRFGNIKLGKKDDVPEFSRGS